MPQVIGPVDHGSALDVAVVPRSAQVFAYRLWIRHGDAAWQLLGEGSTAAAGSHTYAVEPVAGLQLYHWFGIAGEPYAPYECALAFSQANGARPLGSAMVRGQLDASGVGAAQDWVNVQ